MTKKRKIIAAAIIVALVLIAVAAFFIMRGRTGQNAIGDGIYVQKVSDLTGFSFAVDRYSGVIEAQKTQSFKRDAEKKIAEIYVTVGQEVKVGTPLFKYDVRDAENNIASTNLDIEGINNEIAVLRNAGNSTEIQLQISEKQLEIRQKEADLEKFNQEIAQAEVVSNIDGIVKLVNPDENASNQGEELPIVAITEMGEFRVKGKISEQTIGNIYPGMEVLIRSRVDETATWPGTISNIETEPNSNNNNNGGFYYDSSDSGERSSTYPFYVSLDNTDGLMLGQHVFIEPDYGQSEAPKEGLWLDTSFIVFDDDGSCYVWSSERGKTVKKSIEVGETDEENYTTEILSGLTKDDFIAWPDETISEGMKTIEISEVSE